MKAKKKVTRLSDTECVNCKHKYLCYSHQQWVENIQADDGKCDNYQHNRKYLTIQAMKGYEI